MPIYISSGPNLFHRDRRKATKRQPSALSACSACPACPIEFMKHSIGVKLHWHSFNRGRPGRSYWGVYAVNYYDYSEKKIERGDGE